MKKTLLLFAFVSFSILSAKAQIILTSADMPAPEKWYYYANDTLPTVSIGAASATTQNWNMAALVQHTLDTAKALNYSDLPNPLFSTANTILKQGGGDFYGYTNNSSSSFIVIGGHGVFDAQGTPVTVDQTVTPAEIVFNFPATYNSSFNNDFETVATFYFGQQVSGITIDSISRRSYVQKSVTIDAWGTLTTPLGGPYNALRVKEVKKSNDTILAYFFQNWSQIPGGVDSTLTTKYYWWANTIGTALLTVDVDSADMPTNVQWLKEMPVVPPMSVNELAFSSKSINVYPNPTANYITLALDKNLISLINEEPATISVKNIVGQDLKKISLSELSHNDGRIDVSDLKSGIYFVQIETKKLKLNKQFIKE